MKRPIYLLVPLLLTLGFAAFYADWSATERARAPNRDIERAQARGGPDWKPIRNRRFSFALPPAFTKTDARGDDSFVEKYVADGIQLDIDYGMHSNNFGGWPNGTTFERLTIQGKTAIIGVVQRGHYSGYPYSIQVHFKETGKFPLTMFAACRTEQEVDLARRIFLTIRFTSKENPR